MSTRRVTGEQVWKVAGAGYVEVPLWVTLTDKLDGPGCILECGDDGCEEWEADGDLGVSVYVISECEMQNQP